MVADLKFKEWLFVLSLIGILVTLGLISYYRGLQSPVIVAEHLLKETVYISISIAGQVENPGTYHVEKDSKLKDVLSLAKLLPEADVSLLKLDAKLKENQNFQIEKMETITIFLKGEVKKEGPILVKKGAKLKELRELDLFTEKTDLKYMNKRKKLKEGMVLTIPASQNG